MPSLAALTIHAFGVTALAAGFYNLILPSAALTSFALPDSALPVLNASSLAAVAMGIYYNLAGYQENRIFFILTIPVRCLTASFFLRTENPSWRVAGWWEGGGAVLTLGALLWEKKDSIGRDEQKGKRN